MGSLCYFYGDNDKRGSINTFLNLAEKEKGIFKKKGAGEWIRPKAGTTCLEWRNKGNLSSLSSQRDQIERGSDSATRAAADRVSTLIKSWDGLV